MTSISPPEVLNQLSVTIIRLGTDYANFYENLLPQLFFLVPLAQSVDPPRIVVDMQHVKFVGSAFLGFMVKLHKTLTSRESGRFALCGLSSFCNAAVSASRLDSLFEIFETADDSVKAVAVAE